MQLSKWLQVQGLERLDTQLRRAGIDLDILFELDDADLEKIGLSFGDRKRLLKALQASPPVAGETKNAGPTALAIETSAKVAERRQLTVMFCDLVGSTGLSGELDPEDLQQVLGCYHQSVTAAVRRFDGHVAQLLGDGVLVYFGYPKAHEDDADRAVRAGLAVIEAVGKARPTGVLQMQTRVGIATGLVVVSEVGAGTPAAEFSASGETPNLAARLQALAKPGEIVIAPDTRRLIGESFELSSLGMQSLKGIVKPIEPWRVVGVRAVSSRFEADHAYELTQFVGRDGELSTLLERWSMAREGEGQVVLLSGEAGIGKSRVVQTLRDQLMQEASLTLTWQCSPYFVNSTLYPVVQQLERSAAILAAETPEARSEKLEQALAPTELSSESLGYLLKLLGLPDGGRLLAGQTPQQVKSRTLKALVDIVIGLARRQPVLLLLEDAHWIDPTTEELLGQAIERLRDARVLILVTSRPEYSANWGNPTNLTRLALSRLGQRQCVTLIGSVAGGKSLPELVVAEIVKKTDGIPLFVEELTKTVLESGLLRQTDAGYELKGSLTALAIPSTLQDSLMARLDRLAPAKEVAQVGAAIGRVFSHRLLSAVLQMPEAQLNEAINDLVRAELLFRRDDGLDAFYTFKHALVRDTAYASMVKSQRAGRHRQIAAAIEQYQPDAVEAQPELMAHHLQEAGVNDEAIGYWVKAGDRAIAGTNGAEAAAGFDAAIRLISALDDTPDRVDLELDLRRKLGYSLHISGGPNAPSLKENASIAIDLALKFDRMEYVDGFATDFAAATFASGRVAEVVSRIGPLNQDRTVALPSWGRVSIDVLLAMAHWKLGHLDQAWQLLARAQARDDASPATHAHPMAGTDPAVFIRYQTIRLRAYQGYLGHSHALSTDMLSIARSRGHVPTILMAMNGPMLAALLKGEFRTGLGVAREMLELALRFGVNSRIAMATISLGRASIALGEMEKGILLLREGIDRWKSIVGRQNETEYMALAAEALVNVGRIDDARSYLDDASESIHETEEVYMQPELLRLRGRIWEFDGEISRSLAAYRDAIEIAERQGAALLRLRAATDLANLLRNQGNGVEGASILLPVYDWFTEGFDYPDLIRAKTALGAITSPTPAR